MLHLKLPTDPRWVKDAVEGNLEAILTDHAWCEQKAASTAISMIVLYSEFEEVVIAMTDLCREEISHFGMVHQEIIKRGFQLEAERKDEYVNDLMKFVRSGEGKEKRFIDRMLCAAIIEARSCDRFKVLSETLSDKELAGFYRNLMESEARHYATFIRLAKKYADPESVEIRWKLWLDFEAKIIAGYGKGPAVHG